MSYVPTVLTKAVGQNALGQLAPNLPPDVEKVQDLLRKALGPLAQPMLPGKLDDATRQCIVDFQQRWGGTADGVVDPNGQTLKRLVRLAHWAGWHGREVTPGTAGEGRGMTVPAIAVVAAVGDLSFAADSIPAAFAVTHDPVIALTSNLLALATLRSLYFALRGVIGRFRYLKLAIVLMLIVLTGKILHNDFSIVPTLVTLGAMVAILLGAMLGSLRRRFDPGTMRQAHPTPIEDITDAALATRRNVRKIAILIAGTSIIFCGILIAPLPGPGPVVLVPIGLGVLATEFVWAKLLLDRLKAQTASMQRHADVLSVRSPLWLVPLVVVAFWGLAAYLAHAGPFAPWKIYVPAGGMFIPIGYWAIKTVQAKLRRGRKDAGPGEPR